jgi:hypothetical protein
VRKLSDGRNILIANAFIKTFRKIKLESCMYRKKNRVLGEPMWLSGKMMEWENKRNQKIPGSLPSSPGNL